MKPNEKVFLLADDDSDDADLFREALLELDPSIIFYHAPDGLVIWEKLEDKSLLPPQIIFLDINMPGMNGWQCLAKLKNTEAYKKIPVIIYSTTSNKREVEIAQDLGACCFITKPNDFKILKQVLQIIAENLDKDFLKAIAGVSELKGFCSAAPHYDQAEML